MLRWVLLVATLLLLCVPAALAANDQAGGCIRYPGGSIGCDSPTSDSFWTSGWANALYTAIGLAATGGAAFFGYTKVKQRRRSLHDTLKEADLAFQMSKNDPRPGIEKLTGLRAEIATRHKHSKLEDSHFLELDRRIADYIFRLRITDVELHFPELDHQVVDYIGDLLKDGTLSEEDWKRIDKRASALKVPLDLRRRLGPFLMQYNAPQVAV